MKTKLALFAIVSLLWAAAALAEDTNWKDDWKPSAANIAGQGQARVRQLRQS